MTFLQLWNAVIVLFWIAAAEYAIGGILLSVVAFRYVRKWLRHRKWARQSISRLHQFPY